MSIKNNREVVYPHIYHLMLFLPLCTSEFPSGMIFLHPQNFLNIFFFFGYVGLLATECSSFHFSENVFNSSFWGRNNCWINMYMEKIKYMQLFKVMQKDAKTFSLY